MRPSETVREYLKVKLFKWRGKGKIEGDIRSRLGDNNFGALMCEGACVYTNVNVAITKSHNLQP